MDYRIKAYIAVVPGSESVSEARVTAATPREALLQFLGSMTDGPLADQIEAIAVSAERVST